MKETDTYTTVNVEDIAFDTDNPRIKMALEKYGARLTPERIYFALRSATEDGKGGSSSFSSLRDSIRVNGGITVPITVVIKDGEKVCIDGNTRLAIYKDFLKQEVSDDWSKIKSIVIENADQRDIETIRVSAHLIGTKQWPAYEKARYLHYLRDQRLMDYDEMIVLCGGNKTDIERQINAYHDMNEYYRDVVDDTAFQIDRFSGFVELQKKDIKEAIFEAGLDLKDFGEWIRDGKIYRLADVRELPKVLHDKEARDKFLNGGPRSIESAVRLLEAKKEKEPSKTTLENATIYQLAGVLARRINNLPYAEIRILKNREHNDAAENIRTLEDLSDRLQDFLEYVSE